MLAVELCSQCGLQLCMCEICSCGRIVKWNREKNRYGYWDGVLIL